MHYLRKIVSLALALCLTLGLAPRVLAAETEDAVSSEYTWITDRELVDGSDYTQNEELAAALNAIFDGNASIYYDSGFTRQVKAALGTYRVPNNGVNMYVGPLSLQEMNVGTSCWIYANGVYFTLFGEATGCGTAGENSEKLDLSVTKNKNATYENFRAWGVHPGVGALIRTRDGHSMIVLGYDEQRLTILDGNGDGKGLVSIRVRTWDRVYHSVKYIIQPTQAHLDVLYPEESEETQTLGTISDHVLF